MFTNDLPLLLLLCVRCCNRLSVRYILCNIYCELHVVGLLVLCHYAVLFCFVGWFCLVEPNNTHPSPLSYPPLLFGLYSSFSHRDKGGYDFWTISEASLTPIYTIAFISRSIFWHLVPHTNYLFKRNQALCISLFNNFQTIIYADHKVLFPIRTVA
jgi:hypothetical protein